MRVGAAWPASDQPEHGLVRGVGVTVGRGAGRTDIMEDLCARVSSARTSSGTSERRDGSSTAPVANPISCAST